MTVHRNVPCPTNSVGNLNFFIKKQIASGSNNKMIPYCIKYIIPGNFHNKKFLLFVLL